MAQTIIVDTTSGFKQPTLFYSQGDIGRTFSIDLRSRFGDTLPASPTVKIEATKPSGFGFSITADSLSDGIATFTTTEAMTDEAGRFPADLKITKSGNTLYTANFFMEGEPNPHPDGTEDGQASQVLPALTLLVQRVEDAADSIHNLTVVATTLSQGASATATYDDTTNTITFGIPRGSDIQSTDDGDGNIVMTFI